MSRQPDYILKAMDKETDEKSGKIGAGWLNEDGTITLVLDLCIVLDAKDKLQLTLFPKESKK